jgi:hypothetical protein
MAHWRERFKTTDKHLGSVDLWDDAKKGYSTIDVTIEKFVVDKLVGSMGEETKTFVKFKEQPKMMVMNKENFKRLTRLFESPDENDYIGKMVTLGVERVPDPQGGRGAKTDGLRFSGRSNKKAAVEVELKVLDATGMDKAKGMLSKGAITLDTLLKSYKVTESQLKELNDAVKNA